MAAILLQKSKSKRAQNGRFSEVNTICKKNNVWYIWQCNCVKFYKICCFRVKNTSLVSEVARTSYLSCICDY